MEYKDIDLTELTEFSKSKNEIDVQELFNTKELQRSKGFLARQLYEKGIDPVQIQNFNPNEMYIIDGHGEWRDTTPSEVEKVIAERGADGVDLVVSCSLHEMIGGLEIESGYIEIGGVTEFEFDGTSLTIGNDEQFFCTEDLSQELSDITAELGMDAYTRDPNGDLERWVEETSWDDMAFHGFEDGPGGR